MNTYEIKSLLVSTGDFIILLGQIRIIVSAIRRWNLNELSIRTKTTNSRRN
ncbi:hypothetical protein SAMN05660462_02928 [Proteiniborus ethanoligenes]|uniref:Uncharacterized protein n=1 Tax=Proteiniborus ethanoligenes TaxID=415015 RepID=A0A1H3SID9_9FIRM|nr:hypothetical protein SAMN05660462_02928 [Proteiniborus ethanoligenes]